MDLSALEALAGPLQQKMQADAAKRADEIFTGNAGGGAVRVRIDGTLSVKSVAIAPAAATASAGDAGMLEDLVAVAVGDALRQWKSRYGATPEEQMQKALNPADLMAMLGPMMGRR